MKKLCHKTTKQTALLKFNLKIKFTTLCFLVSLFGLQASTLYSQNTITVTGTITETGNGMPIPGVNILEIGTENGTMTDFDGNYTIEVRQTPF